MDKSNSNHARGFIFDFDGLIVDTEPLSIRVWLSSFEEYGVDMTIDELKHLIGTSHDYTVNYIKQRANRPMPDTFFEHDFWLNLIDLIKKNVKAPCKGLVPLLTKINDSGCRAAIASNSTSWYIDQTMEHLQIKQYFTEVVGVEQVQNGKPCPDVYLEAAKRLELPPQKCIAFEDSPTGAQAAINAGIKCILVPNPLLPLPEGPFQVYRSLTDVLNDFDAVTQLG